MLRILKVEHNFTKNNSYMVIYLYPASFLIFYSFLHFLDNIFSRFIKILQMNLLFWMLIMIFMIICSQFLQGCKWWRKQLNKNMIYTIKCLALKTTLLKLQFEFRRTRLIEYVSKTKVRVRTIQKRQKH